MGDIRGTRLPSLLVLAMFLALDAVLVAVHVFGYYGLNVAGEQWSVSFDGGYPEFFQYVKFGWAVLLLVTAAWLRRAWSLLVWVPLFAFLALDDMLRIHERYGSQMPGTGALADLTGLGEQELGELLFMVAVGLTALALMGLGWVLGTADVRATLLDVALLVGLLAFFGVGVDLLHAGVGGGWATVVAGLVEDGGEMVALSLIVAYLFHVASGHDSPRILARLRRPLTPR